MRRYEGDESCSASQEENRCIKRTFKLELLELALEGMQAAADRYALPAARVDIEEVLNTMEPATFVDPKEEQVAGEEAIQGTLEVTMMVGLDPVVW